jgi:hypothetical protein
MMYLASSLIAIGINLSRQIPYPLETTEVQTASRRAVNLWTGRDASNVLGGPTPVKSKPSSVYSSYARTVVGSGAQHPLNNNREDDHQKFCNGCNKVRSGTTASLMLV